MNKFTSVRARLQRGVVLIEVLVSILIFSVAILGVVGLQTTAIRTVRDADYRARASMFANQIIGRMWIDRANVPTYSLNANAVPCSAGTNTGANAAVTTWLSSLTDLSNPGALPGASGLRQQIFVNASNVITLTLCWQAPQDTTPHSFTVNAQIQG